jgi:LPS export ABC transporter protein LptC
MMFASMRTTARLACGAALAGLLAGPAPAQGPAEPAGSLAAPTAEDDAPREPVLSLRGMTYVVSEKDRNAVVLDADSARILPEQELAHMEKVHMRLSSPGEGALDMTCERGTFEMGSGDFLAEGDVQGTTGDGRRFRTERLRYQHQRGLVATNDPVVIRDAAGTYRGGGFRYMVKENRFRLLGGATVEQDG